MAGRSALGWTSAQGVVTPAEQRALGRCPQHTALRSYRAPPADAAQSVAAGPGAGEHAAKQRAQQRLEVELQRARRAAQASRSGILKPYIISRLSVPATPEGQPSLFIPGAPATHAARGNAGGSAGGGGAVARTGVLREVTCGKCGPPARRRPVA